MSDLIYYGVWINWSRGKYNGSTITLSSTSAGVLVAFLAIFISVAGGSLWRILAFIIHQQRVTKISRDGLHYQQQAILRNAATPGVASWQLLRLISPWRKISNRPIWRSIPLIVAALFNLSVFFTAGILVAEVTKSSGSEVLVRSSNCGNWTINSTELFFGYQSKTLNDTISAATYARACYGGPTNALECNRYQVQSLPYTRTEKEPCPFGKQMCLTTTPAFTLDTGNISSHDHFGINTQQRDRVFYRRKTTCAPIVTDGFVTTFNYSDKLIDSVGFVNGFKGDVVDLYNFGPQPYTQPKNFTYAYNRRQATVGIGYVLESVDHSSGDVNNTWNPDKALSVNDGDTSLIFLSANNILYYGEPVKDPIFMAKKVASHLIADGKNVSMYTSNYYVNPLGCVDQHQFCNPVTQNCTKLGSYYQAVKSAQADLHLNAIQYGVVSTLSLDLYISTIAQSINHRGDSALLAQEVVSSLISAPLPQDQWKIEVEYWFSTGLSKLQKYFVDFSTGPTNVLNGTYISTPHDSTSRQLCNSQKIKVPPGFKVSNFSTLGVAIVLAVGGLLILIHLILEYLISNVIATRNYKLVRWALDDKLQMQRLAFESARTGTWKSGIGAVPTTTSKQLFGMEIGGQKEHPTMSFTMDAENGLAHVVVDDVRSPVSPTMSKKSHEEDEEWRPLRRVRTDTSTRIPPIRLFEGDHEVWPLVEEAQSRTVTPVTNRD